MTEELSYTSPAMWEGNFRSSHDLAQNASSSSEGDQSKHLGCLDGKIGVEFGGFLVKFGDLAGGHSPVTAPIELLRNSLRS